MLTGGTGFIGRTLVPALLERGDELSMVTRDPARARRDVPAAVALESWGARDAWRARVHACDAVVHLAGEGVADQRWTPERLEHIRSSRVETTTAIAEAVSCAPTKPVLVSTSAVGIYGMRHDDDVLDEQAAHGSDTLATICVDWEASTEPARRAGGRVAIARLGIVLGKCGGALAKMMPAFKAFTGGPLGDGLQWLSWVHIDDVVRGLLFAIDSAELDRPFNLTAPKPVRMNDFAHALGHALHRPAVLRVPPLALRLALGEGRADMLLSGQRAVPARLERAGFTFEYQTIDTAMESIARC